MKTYKCKKCGRTVTEHELEFEIMLGSMGFCLCEYSQEHRILNILEEI